MTNDILLHNQVEGRAHNGSRGQEYTEKEEEKIVYTRSKASSERHGDKQAKGEERVCRVSGKGKKGHLSVVPCFEFCVVCVGSMGYSLRDVVYK